MSPNYRRLMCACKNASIGKTYYLLGNHTTTFMKRTNAYIK